MNSTHSSHSLTDVTLEQAILKLQEIDKENIALRGNISLVNLYLLLNPVMINSKQQLEHVYYAWICRPIANFARTYLP